MKTNDLHFFLFLLQENPTNRAQTFYVGALLARRKNPNTFKNCIVSRPNSRVGSRSCSRGRSRERWLLCLSSFLYLLFFWYYRVSKFWFYADDYKNLTPPMLWYTPQNEATCRQRSYVVKSLNLRVPPVESKHFWLFFDLIKVSRRSAFLWSD